MPQFMEPVRVQGIYDLEDLENRCGTLQNMVPCKLVRITIKTDEPGSNFNAALFEVVNVGDTPPKPKLLSVHNPEQIPGLIADQMQHGRKLIFDSIIFVNNVKSRVLGFR